MWLVYLQKLIIISKTICSRLDMASLNDQQHPRLEITELSDEELPIDDEDDHDFHHPGSRNHTSNRRHGGGNKIFEIASGLY